MNRSITVIATIIFLIVTAGCTRKVYVPVATTTHSHDTLHIVRTCRDTLLLRDSIHIHTRGDTVFKDVTRDRIRVSLQHDTVVRTVSDTIVKEIHAAAESSGMRASKNGSALLTPLIWAAAIALLLIVVKVLKKY